MTKREMNLRIFENKVIPNIFFQPRIEWWYQYNKVRGTLPEKYKKMSLRELFDDLDVSIRYFAYATGLAGAIGMKHTKEVKVKERMEEEERLVIISTPKGDLIQKMKQSSDGGWRTTEFPVKTGEDIEKAIWLFENTYYVFIKKNFEKGSKFFKDRGELQFFVPRSGYQHLAIRVMGVENLIYALSDFPKKVERLMQAIDNSYDTLYKDIVSYGKVKIINFGRKYRC